jgi:hypothetical protein
MLDHSSATILPFRPAARRAPAPGTGVPALGGEHGISEAGEDNVVLLRENVIVLADRIARLGRRRADVRVLFPASGGDAA